MPTRDEDWPSVADILGFQSKVRQRVFKLYDDIESGSVVLTRKIARVLFMTLEHEAFHAEVKYTPSEDTQDQELNGVCPALDASVHVAAARRHRYDPAEWIQPASLVHPRRVMGPCSPAEDAHYHAWSFHCYARARR